MGALTARSVSAALAVALLVSACSSSASASSVASGPGGASAATATATAQAQAAATPVPQTTTASTTPSLAQLIGQKLVVRMDGTTPSASLLGRIGRGEIGGVILFGFNVTSKTQLIKVTAQLQAAATAGGQPPLLIATDQEGASVRRIPWAPPTLSVPAMGKLDSTAVARSQGASTAAALKAFGINVDFAPVADVPASTSSFMYLEGRTWSFSAVHTAALSDAFATGLESKGVIPSMKHFPGIGFATHNTDTSVVTIGVSKTRLGPGLRPYQTAISHHIPLIMLSNATYSAYDTSRAAGWSYAISTTLLRGTLGFKGVTITDSLSGTAAARGLTTRLLAVRAAFAGTDMILVTGSEASTRAVYATLLGNAKDGTIPRSRLVASYDRILAMKAGL